MKWINVPPKLPSSSIKSIQLTPMHLRHRPLLRLNCAPFDNHHNEFKDIIEWSDYESSISICAATSLKELDFPIRPSMLGRVPSMRESFTIGWHWIGWTKISEANVGETIRAIPSTHAWLTATDWIVRVDHRAQKPIVGSASRVRRTKTKRI